MDMVIINSATEFANRIEPIRRRYSWINDWSVAVHVWMDVLDGYPHLADEVVHGTNLPDEVIDRMSRWPDSAVRSSIVRKEGLPDATLNILKSDISVDVREALVWKLSADLGELASVIGRDDYEARSMAEIMKKFLGKQWFAIPQRAKVPRSFPYESTFAFAVVLRSAGFDDLDPDSISNLPRWVEAAGASSEIGDWLSNTGRTNHLILAAMAESSFRDPPVHVARNDACPPEILAALALDADIKVRRRVVVNPKLDLPSLLILASDDAKDVRESARKWLGVRFGVNLSTRQTVLIPAADQFDQIDTVQDYLLLHRSADPINRMRARFGFLPKELLPDLANQLSKDPWALIWNHSLTAEDLKLVIDGIYGTQGWYAWSLWHDVPLLQRPEIGRFIAAHPDIEARWGVSFSMNADESALLVLAKPDQMLLDVNSVADRIALCARDDLNAEFDYSFARPSWDDSRRYQEYFHTADQFIQLCSRGDSAEQFEAVHLKPSRNRLWREVLQTRPDLAKRVVINETVGPQLLDELADWPDPEVRGWVAEHPRAWQKTLVRLGNDRDDDVRRYAVYYARMPDSQLRKMTSDPVERTRSEAAFRLAARAYARRLLVDPNWWQHLGNSEI